MPQFKRTDEMKAIKREERGERLALSFAQQRMWFLSQMGGVSALYNIPICLRLRGRLDRTVLRRALDRVLARHESLRTTFEVIDGTPVQRIATVEDSRFALAEQDLREQTDVEVEVERLVAQEFSSTFDLEDGPLIRGRLIRLSEDEHALLITMHHIISDGWSMGILTYELSSLYTSFLRGEDDPLPRLEVQYVDYVIWQRRWIEGQILQQQAAYWKTALAGAPAILQIPTDRPRPVQQDFTGGVAELTFSEDLAVQLKKLSRRHGATLYMTLLAAWGVLLARLSGQTDVVIGSPTANRSRDEIENLIGFFANTLPLRLDVSGSPTVSELIKQAKTTTIAAQQNQDIPFEKIVELVNPVRNLSHSPLFQVMFAWQNYRAGSLELADIEAVPLPAPVHQLAKFDLTLFLQESGNTINGGIEYATSLFERATVERYLGFFRILLEAMVADDTQAVDRLPVLGEVERHRVLYEWNDTGTEFPSDKCVHQLFEEQVEKSPDATAVVFEHESLSYAELNTRANQLAHYLRELGVVPDARVAICMERSLEMVVGLMAVEKAGGAYVPIDPTYPIERLRFMLEDSQPVLFLTQSHLRDIFDGLSAARPVLDLGERTPPWMDQPKSNPDPNAVGLCSRNLAYIIYTSGSTGTPKGVMVEHQGVVNRLVWMQNAYELNRYDAILQKTSFGFDVSIWEFFWTLIAGAKLVMARPEGHRDPSYLIATILRNRITTIHFVPSLLRVFLEYVELDKISVLTRVVCSGEALSSALVQRFQEKLPNAILYNLYGPTEAAVDVTAWTCPATFAQSVVPIGKPIANTRIYILDSHGEPVPVGVVGELYIGGVQVARGYLNRPELTSERFLKDPFTDEANRRMYRTGDIGRYLQDGNIDFLGRNDFQVKIRGFRIELGEIESCLAAHPSIRDSVVIAYDYAVGDTRLIAYFSQRGDVKIQDIGELRAFLSSQLPRHMIPAAFVRLESFPVTENGKVNRKALSVPTDSVNSRKEICDPVGRVERQLATVWAAALKLDRVGRHENFFDLGGHSLMAMTVVASLARIGIDVKVVDLFVHPTIEALAANLVMKEMAGPSDQAVLVRRGSVDYPLFFVHCGTGELLYLRSLVPNINSEIPIYGLPATATNRKQLNTIEDMARRMVGMILEVQQHGYYRIAGWCIGGVIAYETARQLISSGRDVEFIGLIDSYYVQGLGVVDSQHDLRFDENRSFLRWVSAETDRNEKLQAALESLIDDAKHMSFSDLVKSCIEAGLMPERFQGLIYSEIYEWLAREDVFVHASRMYTGHEISSNVHLFASSRNDRNKLDMGWASVVPRNYLTIEKIPGSHASMMRSPNVEILGEAISRSVARSSLKFKEGLEVM